jgi:hypothetical protein
MRCSGDVETKTVHDSTVTVTNVVSSSTSSLMRLHRLLRVDTAKMTVPHGQQAGRPRVRIKLYGGDEGECSRRLRASSVRCARLMVEEVVVNV